MNYSLPKFTINYKDFLNGQNLYDSYPSGGIKKISDRVNIFYKPGYLTSGPAKADATVSLQRNPVNSFSFGAITSFTGCAVGSNGAQDGYFYSVTENGVMTLEGSADTAHDYNIGFIDTKYYNNRFYTTSKTDIVENVPSMASASRDLTFWTVTKGQAALSSTKPHPMVVYGSILYIADGQYLHSLDTTTAASNVLDLGVGYTITALTEYLGYIYIAAEAYTNAGATLHGLGKLLTWNGYAKTWIDEWNYDQRIDSMVVFENVLYAFTSSFVSYFSGGRFIPMRPLIGRVYPHQIALIDRSMFFSDGSHLVRYGSPVPGARKVFTEIIDPASDGVYTGLLATENRKLLLAETIVTGLAGKVSLISDVTAPNSSSGSSNVVYFNERNFIRPIKIRGILVETEQLSTGQYVSVRWIDDNGTASATYRHSASASKNLNRRTFDVVAGGPLTSMSPYIEIGQGAMVKQITFFYEASEVTLKN